MSEQQEFLKELEINPEEDVLNKPIEVESQEPPVKEETEDETEMKIRNRRERRINEKLQKEREANIALNARLQALSEARSIRETSSEEEDFLKAIEPIFGNDTPEKREATELLKKAIKGANENAYQKAKTDILQIIQEERGNEQRAIQEAEESIDEMMEKLEDEYNVDFSDKNTRNGFLSLLEKLSPKDEDGNIIEYADPVATYELYESRKEKSSGRARELASRSMVRGGTGQSTLKDDATERFLKENGII